MVPAWTLALAFAAGLVVGIVACRLVVGRARPAAEALPAAVTGPEPVTPESAAPAPEVVPEVVPAAVPEVVPVPVAEPEPESAVAEATAAEEPAASEEAESEDPAAAVDDVVAELERRVKGRRTEGENERPTARRGRRA